MLVSSAYFIIGMFEYELVQSLVYIENRIGARTVPCGAPVFVIIVEELKTWSPDLIDTNCGLFVRKSKIHKEVFLAIPMFKSLGIIRWGWIVLKALEKSIKSVRTYAFGMSKWE